MTNPEIILLDEVSLGLSPLVVGRVYEQLEALKGSGVAIVLVEQDLKRAMATASRAICMLEGAIAIEGATAELTHEAGDARLFRPAARRRARSAGMIFLNQIIQGVLLGGYYALIACGLSFMFSVMRIINLAHGSLAILAAYALFVLADRYDVSPFLGLVAVVPAMALIGAGLQRAVLERSARGGLLVPVLSTFGLSIVIDNLLFQQFGADTRSLAPYIGDLSYDSWSITDDIAIGKLAALTMATAIVAARRHPALPQSHPARPHDPRHRRGFRHGRSGRRQRAPGQRAGGGDRHGDGGDFRRLPGDARDLRPLRRRVAAHLRLRGRGHRRRRLAVGHPVRRNRARRRAEPRRLDQPAGLLPRRPRDLPRRAVPAPLFRRFRPAPAPLRRGGRRERALAVVVERWTRESRVALAVAGVAASCWRSGRCGSAPTASTG